MRALEQAPWQGEFDPLEGVILHEPEPKTLRSPPNRPDNRHSPSSGYAMREYDAIIIGTGQSGPSLATRLAGAGQTVAIIERKLFGGTCVNTGCTPTKTLVASAYAAHLARRAAEFGVVISGAVAVDMRAVKARKDAIVASLAATASRARCETTESCTVYGATPASSRPKRSRSAASRSSADTHLHQRRRPRRRAADPRARPGPLPHQHAR